MTSDREKVRPARRRIKRKRTRADREQTSWKRQWLGGHLIDSLVTGKIKNRDGYMFVAK